MAQRTTQKAQVLSWKEEKALVDKQRNLKEVNPEKEKAGEHSVTSLFQIGVQYATTEETHSIAVTAVPKFTT